MNVLSISPTAFRRPGMLDNAQHSTVTVQYGDTMIGIAQRLNVPFDKLRDANPQIVDPNWIYPGDVLTVPKHAPATMDVADTLLTGHHPIGDFFRGSVSSAEKQGEVLYALDASHSRGKEILYQGAEEPKETLMVSAGGGERKWGASRATKYRNSQWQKPEVERHNEEKIVDRPAITWERELFKIDSNESQKALIESQYLNARYEKWHEATEVRAQASANSDGLNFDAVASSHRAAHRIAASGGVDNLRVTVDAEVLSYYGEARVNAELNKKGFKTEAVVGAGAHLVKGQGEITLQTPSFWGVSGRMVCQGGVGAGVEGYLGASIEISNSKAELGFSVAGSVGVGANGACSVGIGFYE